MKTDLNDYLDLETSQNYKFKQGDVLIWRNSNRGNLELHTFHSDAGYGAKTYTDYNESNGSSRLINYSGITAVLKLKT